MRKILLTLWLASCTALGFAGSKVTYTTDITRDVQKTSDAPTLMRVSTNAIVEAFKLSSEEGLEKALAAGSVKFVAKQGSQDKTYNTPAYGNYGYWFTKSGVGCAASNTNRRVACKYEKGYFYVIHNTTTNAKGLPYVNTGDVYSFAEMFVQGADTVQYVFHVTMGADERIDSDQPDYVETIEHRADEVDAWPVQPLVRRNDEDWMKQNYIQVMEGDKITFSCGDSDEYDVYRVQYRSKDDKTLRSYKIDEFMLTESATPADAGYYYCDVRYKKGSATYTKTGLRLYVDVQTQPLGTPWDWTGEVPQLSYDFHDEYADLSAPTKVHTLKKKDGTPANQELGEWWSVFWGDDLNAEVGGQEKARDAAQNMVKKYDEDFTYIYDNIGWPPNLSARNGYRSFPHCGWAAEGK